MITYRFTISERELEVILSALGTMAGTGNEDPEARALLVRLDKEADAQFSDVENTRNTPVD